jgi:hypothetical protein
MPDVLFVVLMRTTCQDLRLFEEQETKRMEKLKKRLGVEDEEEKEKEKQEEDGEGVQTDCFVGEVVRQDNLDIESRSSNPMQDKTLPSEEF